MRAVLILILLCSVSLADEAKTVDVIHNYHDPATEVWEVHVQDGSVITNEEPEAIDSFDFRRFETHAAAGGMPIAFFFHPGAESRQFLNGLYLFLQKSNALSLKYTATLVLPGERGVTFRTSSIHSDQAGKLIISKDLNSWVLNGEKLSMLEVFDSVEKKRGDLALTVDLDVFESLEAMRGLRRIVKILNSYDDYGEPLYHYTLKLAPKLDSNQSTEKSK